jgi:DNA-binding response OmpR family regulator
MAGDEKRPLGKILLQRKLVSPEQLDQALRQQKRSPNPEPIASQLVDTGTVQEIDALRALSEQYGVPGIDLAQIAVVLETLDLVPREVAESHRILPLLVRGERLFLAMGDPQDKRVIDEIEFVTNRKVYPYVAMQTTLVKVIAEAYEARERGELHYLGPRVPAETLRQLGLDPATQAPLRAPTPEPEPEAPPAESVVVDEAVQEVREEDLVSESEFGNVSEDVSSVTNLPDDLRARTAQATEAMTAGSGKLVLIVDDEDEIRKMLRRLFTQKGLRVIEADRGLLALRLVKEHVPDLIILDAMLPELHGFDIARRIKGSEKYGHIPVIMVSAVYRGWRFAEDLRSNYGVEAYIEKPFKIAEMLETVTKLLSREAGKPEEPARDPEYLSAEANKALEDGVAAYRNGKLDEAIAHLKRGVQIDPLAYRLHFHLALLHGKKGEVYEGIQELERAIDLNPKHFPALKNLAVLYEKAGFKNKAVEMWERCAGVAPDEATAASIKEHLVKLL